MSIQRIAARYANTLVSAARDKDVLDHVDKDVLMFQTAYDDSRDLQLLLASPIIDKGKKIKVLTEIFSGKVSDLFMRFLKIVCRKGREPYMNEISQAIHQEYKEIKGITEAIVITASELSDETLQSIKTIIHTLPGTKEEIHITHQLDESLIGGFVVKYDDNIYDNSVSHKLNNLRRQIAG